jgi:hypothetical protein
LVLQFEVGPNAMLKDLRINMIDFLGITSYANDRSAKITFCIVDQVGAQLHANSVSLREFRAMTLIALTEFKRAFNPRINSKTCPNIWVNGLGRIVQAERFEKSINPWEFMVNYILYSEHRCQIEKYYGSDPYESIYYNDENWYNYYAPPEGTSFDSSLRCYLGYLRNLMMYDDSVYWARERKFSNASSNNRSKLTCSDFFRPGL